MRNVSRINVCLVNYLFFFLFSCKSEINPCECGENLMKSNNEIDEKLESKCEEYSMKLSSSKRKIWNKKMLDCTSIK